jgi:RNA polymerase sigma-70 factor (ECF subfamily)
VTRSLPALAARAQLGDRNALEELLRQLLPPLREHLEGILGDDDQAADVLQDALIIVSRRLGTVRQTEWIRAWAYRIATREALRALRRAHQNRGVPLDDMLAVPAVPVTAPDTNQDELLAELPDRLAALPAGAQVVLRLHYLHSMTQQEISEALEIPLGTVKSRLAYGLMCLRRSLVPRDPRPRSRN